MRDLFFNAPVPPPLPAIHEPMFVPHSFRKRRPALVLSTLKKPRLSRSK